MGKNYENLIQRHPISNIKPVNIAARIEDIPVSDRKFFGSRRKRYISWSVRFGHSSEMEEKLAPYEKKLLQAQIALDEFDGIHHYEEGKSPIDVVQDRKILEKNYQQVLAEVSGPMQSIRLEYQHNCPEVAQQIEYSNMELFLDGLMKGMSDLYGEDIAIGFLKHLGLLEQEL
ncbi:MAG: hypothetical protein R3A11_04790 [Bdellovibrionota bacterium]